MANRPPKKTGRASGDQADRPSEPLRGSGPQPANKQSGMGEMPQADFEGAPISGESVSDWVKQLEEDAARDARNEETREIRSKAGKHRRKVERAAAREDQKGDRPSAPSRGSAYAKRDNQAIGDKRTGGGTSIGGTNDPKKRAAAGLNPVAGLNVSLEEANQLASTSGVTATVEALQSLIQSGNPLFKDGQQWVPHRPARPEKSEGGIEIKMSPTTNPRVTSLLRLPTLWRVYEEQLPPWQGKGA